MLRPCVAFCLRAAAAAQKTKPIFATAEDEYYQILRFELPPGEVLEAGAIEIMPDGKVAVGTRRGEIWMIDNAYADDPKQAKFTRFAHGLHEILGLAQKDGWLYVTQRPDVTRIKDTDGDGKADVFEVVTDGWEINGDYHEYAFGSRFDKDGNIWIALCLTGSFNSNSKFRGWAGKVTPEGKFVPTTSGVRSPGGVGFNADGDIFYTDNQGPWNGGCCLKQLTVGGFVGHPGQLQVVQGAGSEVPRRRPAGAQERQPDHDRGEEHPAARAAGSHVPVRQDGPVGQRHRLRSDRRQVRAVREATLRRRPDAQHGHARLPGEGRTAATRGRAYPFRQGFGSGIVPVRFGKDGSLFVGGTNRGWGSRGTKPFAIERLVWTGKAPFEIHEMKAKPDGFELTFTKPVDADDGGQGRVVPDEDVHLHLSADLRQPGGRSDDAEDHARPKSARTARACGSTSRACRKGTSTT